MALSLKDFVETYVHQDDAEETHRCGQCNRVLRETITGCRKTEAGYRCSDCYFKELSDLIEQSPIRTPYARRG